MFGRRYVVYTRPTLGEVLGSLLVYLIIAFILIMLAVYVSWIILAVFVGIGVVIGLCYALFIYIRALIGAIRAGVGYSARSSGAVMAVFERLFVISLTAAQTAFQDNLTIASNAVARSQGYRVLSFRKWMWLVVALAVIVFGLCLIVAVILAELGILAGVALAVLSVLALICLLYCIAALIYALIFGGKIAWTAVVDQHDFSCFVFNKYATFSDVGRAFGIYFPWIGRCVAQLWQETLTLARDNFTDSLTRPVLSLSRWLLFVSPVMLVPCACLYTVLVALAFGLLFLFAWPAFVIWTCIAKLISLFP